MRIRSRNPFATVRTSGLLLPIDLLARIADGDPLLPGLSPQDYHLRSSERLNEAASRAWNECLAAWRTFRRKFNALPPTASGTSETRDDWLLPLFRELGYGQLQTKKAIRIGEREYPVSHGWENHVPIHLLSARYPLDRRTPGVAGAAAASPYSMLQELLNRSAGHRWGFLSNGLKLYILHDNAALARAANVEFDLEAMMDGEVYSDFLLLFLVCHQSRVEIPPDGKPTDCWLEKWAGLADEQGTRAREKLRDGVEAAIQALGAGFLTTRGNGALRERLRSGALSKEDYYRQLLRLVYRLLLLLVAEEKTTETGENLLHPPGTPPEVRERYARFYSIGRLRALAEQRRGTPHPDLYESLKVLFLKLREGYPPLGIPGLGSFLFSDQSTPDLDSAALANESLLDAIRHLCFTEDVSGRGGAVRRPVDFAHLGSEELGSVYESLLELHPQIDTDEGPFKLTTAAGHERKTTGSYYTPRSLINCLLDSALDPVVQEALDKPTPQEAEQALLNLKVCDPACGSGHFLIAAAERMATHLARLRTGDREPTTLGVQHAKRDIIGRCIYGVDLNPMAVELCKVSLWMEALEPGKPLSFLDHHIQCGNSLLGTTPALLANGIPDDAFKPIEGDDKSVCSELKKDNKRERRDYERGYRDFHFTYQLGDLPSEFARLTASVDDSVADAAAKEQRYAELVKGASYRNARLLADAWCAAFVWQKDQSPLGKLCPTERTFRNLQASPDSVLPHVRAEIERLRDQYQFFHWHLAFPDVFRLPGANETPHNEPTGWNGGFDVVLGNPPWERVKLQEKEWFAERNPEIANAPNAAARKRLIEALRVSEPTLHAQFLSAVRQAEGESHLLRNTGRFPLCGRGDINVYAVFAELMRNLASPTGRSGCVLPSGIATDDTTKFFFQDVVETHSLVSLFDFENRNAIFPGVHRSYKFCLFTTGGPQRTAAEPATFVFFAHQVEDLADPERRFSLSAEEIALLNPNTRTCPIFRSRRDAELTKAIYRRVPVLIRESRGGQPEENPWGITFSRMFDMSNDSHLFRTRAQLEAEGWTLEGNIFRRGGEEYLPLYEAKMIHHFDHRWATYEGLETREVSNAEKCDPTCVAQGRYWVSAEDVQSALANTGWTRRWLQGFRDITNTTNERTVVSSVFRLVGVGNKIPLLVGLFGEPLLRGSLSANLGALAFDYPSRQKIGGTTLNFFLFQQLAVLPPEKYSQPCPWSGPTHHSPSATHHSLSHWLLPRVLELTYTAWDLEPFARDCGYTGPPFRWDEARRFLLRAELDAAFFHLYLPADAHGDWVPARKSNGCPHDESPADLARLKASFPTPRDAVDYILETFPIVKRKDIEKHGTYKTKETILAIYDEMAEAIRTGRPYPTRLNPPPGPPTDDQGNFIPVEQWTSWPSHIHPLRAAVRRAPTAMQVQRGRASAYVQLLLHEWAKPVERGAVEVGLILMLNDTLRRAVLNDQSPPNGAATIVRGMDAFLGSMRDSQFIQVNDTGSRQVLQLGPAAAGIDSFLAEDRERAKEAVSAVQKVGESRVRTTLSAVEGSLELELVS